MKRILILIIGLIGVAQAQYSPTSAKSRFVNGLALGTKLDSYFNAADSNAIYWRADSSLMAKYKGTARALAFAVSGGYLPISDTASMLSNYRRTSTRIENSDLRFSTISGVSLGASLFGLSTGYGLNGSGYDGGAIRTWEADTNAVSTKANVVALLLGYATNANLATKLNISDTATMLSNYRRTSTKITNSDLANSTISGISLGSNLASLTNGYGISGSAYNGSTGYTWLVDTSAISTKANVTGLLTGYATTGALSGYLPLTAGSGNPLSGDLYITKAAPLVFLNSTSTNSNGFVHQVSGTNYWGTGLNINSTDESWSVFNYSLSAKPISINRTTNAITLGGALSGTSLSMSGEGLFGGAVTNGTDKLIVAGSVYASNSGNTYKSFLGAYYKERNNNGSNAGGYEWEEALGYGVSSTIKGSLQFGNKYVNSFETAARIVLTNAANSQYAALSFDGNTGAATFSSSVTAVGVTVASGGQLIFQSASSRLVSGSTDFAINNSANTLNQLLINDGTGAATFRSSVTASGGVIAKGITNDNTAFALDATNSSGSSLFKVRNDGAAIYSSLTGSGIRVVTSSSAGQLAATLLYTTAETASTLAQRDGSGALTATGFVVSSDLRFKDIITQDGDLYQYTLKADEEKKIHYGYIAQEVEKTLPFTVTTNSDGYKAVNYIEVHAIKIRELEKQIEELKKLIKK